MTDVEAPAAPEVKLEAGQVLWGTGRRKSSVARVRLMLGSGRLEINGRSLDTFFPGEEQKIAVRAPLKAVDGLTRYDVIAGVKGGGFTGQSGAIRLGIARALKQAEPQAEEILKAQGYLTRDSRMKERKKYGLRGARRAFQFSKR